MTNFLIVFLIFGQLQSQISQIDKYGYNPFCDETHQIFNIELCSERRFMVNSNLETVPGFL